jgi:hypothetical protein
LVYSVPNPSSGADDRRARHEVLLTYSPRCRRGRDRTPRRTGACRQHRGAPYAVCAAPRPGVSYGARDAAIRRRCRGRDPGSSSSRTPRYMDRRRHSSPSVRHARPLQRRIARLAALFRGCGWTVAVHRHRTPSVWQRRAGRLHHRHGARDHRLGADRGGTTRTDDGPAMGCHHPFEAGRPAIRRDSAF